MKEFIIRKFYPSEMIFKEGAPGFTAYLVKTGRVEIFVEDSGHSITLATLGPSSVFGETAILSKDQKRTASAKALEYTELLEIGRQDFAEFMEKSPAIISQLLKALVQRLQKTTEKVSNLPDLFMGTCEILNLLAHHKTERLDYEQTLRSISNALNVESSRIKEKLELLRDINLIEMPSKETIRILKKETFLLSARKIYNNAGRHL